MEYMHNYVSESKDGKGYISFSRFYPEQLKAYEDNAMYREMAKSTSGMYLGFMTNASSISFSCKTESRIKMILPIVRQVKVRAVMQMVKKMGVRSFYKNKKQKDLVDGIDLVVDGVLVETQKAKKGTIHFHIPNPDGKFRVIKIYFPAIDRIAIQELKLNGKVSELPEREQILCLGDSITQGMISGAPSLNYVSLLAEKLQVDALNQGVGGYVFCADSLNGLEQLATPKFITVAYGTNDWTNKSGEEEIRKDIMTYFNKLKSIFPEVPVYVITPIWRADWYNEMPCRIKFQQMHEIIIDICSKFSNIQLINGMLLLTHDTNLYTDSFLHPNASGFKEMAHNLINEIGERVR